MGRNISQGTDTKNYNGCYSFICLNFDMQVFTNLSKQPIEQCTQVNFRLKLVGGAQGLYSSDGQQIGSQSRLIIVWLELQEGLSREMGVRILRVTVVMDHDRSLRNYSCAGLRNYLSLTCRACCHVWNQDSKGITAGDQKRNFGEQHYK